jgi:hypothetical protein
LASCSFSSPSEAQLLPAAKEAAHVEITEGPALELAHDDLAIVRWTISNPEGSDDHFGVVHYGTDAKDLGRRAESHIRLNRAHAKTIFRVRISGLQPGTTYYYRVASIEGDGRSDGVTSTVNRFAMLTRGERFLAHPAQPAWRSEQINDRLAKTETLPPPADKSSESAYDPYPSGILPSDLKSETARVERETRRIFNQTLAKWRALPAHALTDTPPRLPSLGYQTIRTLGKLMNFDLNVSPFRNVSMGTRYRIPIGTRLPASA